MPKLEILTKTYAPDLEVFEDLHASIAAFTDEDVLHRVVVDDADKGLFERFRSERCEILSVRDALPKAFINVPTKNLMVNLRRPWPPIRGWVSQQLVKLSMAEQSNADVILLMDSDVVLRRKVSADTFKTGDQLNFFRLPGSIHDGMERHILWHKAARKLLRLPDEVSTPLTDYVNPFNVWSPDVVRALCSKVSDESGLPWQTAVAANLHVSEFILYGVFVDEVLGDTAPLHVVDNLRCHNYWDEVPLDLGAALAFASRAGDDDIAMMISAKSRTEISVRRQAIAQAQGICMDNLPVDPRGPGSQSPKS
jgi:hypothetical protein